jgi:acetyl esterase/lipase
MKHVICLFCLALAAATALAQGAAPPPAFVITPSSAPDESNALPLTDVPNGRATEQWQTIFTGRTVRNVTQPALIPFLPPAGKANGAAVIVAPGGGYLSLSMDSEGYDVATWLAQRGVTAFVLKYRTEPTPRDLPEFEKSLHQLFGALMKQGSGTTPPGEARAVEDALLALRYVRGNAARWGIAPGRIGIVGFSAGGRAATSAAMRFDAASRPDFLGAIYGALSSKAPVPSDAPPAFVAAAADDPLGGPSRGTDVFDAWRAAGRPVELHIYQGGGHGFGMRRQGTTSDHWIDAFYWWLDAAGFLK